MGKNNHTPNARESNQLQFIDLFAGCGGFTLGLERAGLRAVAAIDFNPEAVATFRRNLPHVPHALKEDLTKYGPQQLAEKIGNERVDVIVGGPPCQGFSTARKRDGANHGVRRLVEDERRHLYKQFLQYVQYFRPLLFVIENVLGIRSAAGGEYFTRVHAEARLLGYRVHGQVEDAWALGVPQRRRRQLIIGVRNDIPGYFPPTLEPPSRAIPFLTLGAAIGDLPVLRAGAGEDPCRYDLHRRKRWLNSQGRETKRFLYRIAEVTRTPQLSNHVARPHSPRDLRDFSRLKEGESSAIAMRERGVRFEFPYDKETFKDRYTRQSRSKPCSTIVAHLSKDGLMFVHPTQNRSLTPREAARVQTFPDWFEFPAARTHAFRLIGNAVPPLVAESVGSSVLKFVACHVYGAGRARSSAEHPNIRQIRSPATVVVPDRDAAIGELHRASSVTVHELRSLERDRFLRLWHALLFVMPDLHPVNALDHGSHEQDRDSTLPFLPAELQRHFVRSGWPVLLASLGTEAWRRYEKGELAESLFYCTEVQRAGLEACGINLYEDRRLACR